MTKARTTDNGVDTIEMLKTDHEMVKDLFAKYEDSKHDSSEKELVAEEVFAELEVHARIEEEIFYPAVREAADAHGQELVAEAIEEHQAVTRLIEELRTLELEVEEYDAKFKVLSENVEHHAKEEEDEMFPVARKVLGDELGRLGQEMKRRKQDLGAEAA